MDAKPPRRRPQARVKSAIKPLVAFAQSLERDVRAALCSKRTAAALRQLEAEFSAARNNKDDDDFAATCAQTIACVLAIFTRRGGLPLRPEMHRWLATADEPLARELFRWLCATAGGEDCADSPFDVLELAARWETCEARRLLAANDKKLPPHHDSLSLFEDFLSEYDRQRRRRRGVYFTPAAVAAYIVHRVDRSLRDEFGLSRGLIDTATWSSVAGASPSMNGEADRPFVRILDPAAGAGVFLVEIINRTRRSFFELADGGSKTQQHIQQRWNEYAAGSLLPQMTGFELMPAACAVANLNIAFGLAGAGFDFNACPPPPVQCRDALADPDLARNFHGGPFTVIVGNPPYSGVSHNRHAWIENLLKGRLPDGRPTASYYEADGAPLNERKVWLQDDYVKFLRWGQAQIERAGCGIVAMVTNHGYLDNVTFRGMRRQLMRAFPSIDILDLHGNRKKHEQPPHGGRDENVFNIEQGVAIGLLRRPPGERSAEVKHAELWGTRAEKLSALDASSQSHPENNNGNGAAPITAQTIAPSPPYFFFAPHDDSLQREYEGGLRLCDIMPVNTTAPVTARDGFVVATSEAELHERLAAFRDLSIPDDEIRRRYFDNTRSAKYPPGDTRGWKLAEARRIAAADPNWREHIVRCLYRPFDWRYVYWTDWMIDWPRTPVMQHLLAGGNLALIARRQMLAARPCDYFWITDSLALDGVIRSDNRGSESLFPLYLHEQNANSSASPTRRANYTSEFVSHAAARLNWQWLPLGAGDLEKTFGPDDLLHYIYACFHSIAFRQRYAASLRLDFPRVFITAQQELFRTLSGLGKQLVELHLLTSGPSSGGTGGLPTRVVTRGRNRRDNGSRASLPLIAPGFPQNRDGQVFINGNTCIADVDDDAWTFQAGAHQVCRKWLRDRRGRALTDDDISHYRHLVASIRQTIDVMQQIDQTINAHGGWPDAFQVGEHALQESRQGPKTPRKRNDRKVRDDHNRESPLSS